MFKNLKKQVRPWDYIIFLILLIVSFIPLAIFGYSQKQQMAAAADNNTKPIIYAEISIDKKVIKKIKLSKKTALCQILLIDSFTELEAKRLLVLFLYLVLFSFVEV